MKTYWPFLLVAFVMLVKLVLLIEVMWDQRPVPRLPVVEAVKYGAFRRYVSTVGKVPVACPTPDKDTGVLLVIGQSNAANCTLEKFTTAYPQQVVNFYDGRCYVAASPLLGASCEGGEWITPLADHLVEDGVYRKLVLVTSAVGGTSVARWQAGGDLNALLLRTIKALPYKITDIIWHQGETDFEVGMNAETYSADFHSLLDSLHAVGVAAPVFAAVASKCGLVKKPWFADNPVVQAQRGLIDNRTVFLGADTDALLDVSDRFEKDHCHFSASGETKTAATFADAMRRYHQAK